eukprot:531202_1
MIIYLSLKQILLNQIAVLIRKQSDKSNDDPERLLRRLNYLQKALEEIKSYQHNSNFQYVIKHFNIDPTDTEQLQIRELSRVFDDLGDPAKREKSGFTTQRSETLFTGAAEEQYPKFYGSDNEMDEKQPSSHHQQAAPRWITYRGFAHWLKKQSFIKFKRRNDQEKYKKIWNTVLGLKMIYQWDKGIITPDNIIGRYGTTQPYIAIHKCGTKEIVKASLLRLSITQNRIFKFNVDASDVSNARTKYSRSRARGSVDLDNDEEQLEAYANGLQLNANQLIQGRNLFDQVQNKDVLRIVATMLWNKDLANNVLEELLHNPRFSMYGIHAKNIADTIAKEMNLQTMSSYDTEQTPMDDRKDAHQPVEQFAIPSKPKPPQQRPPNTGNVYNAQNTNGNPSGNFSFQQAKSKQSQKYQHNEPQSVPENYTPSPSPNILSPNVMSPELEAAKPHHRPQSASVVMHDNIRDSEIHDYGAHNEYDSEEHEEYHDGDAEDESMSNDGRYDPQQFSVRDNT